MKKAILGLLFLCLGIVSATAPAKAGPRSDGGTDRLIEAFVLIANTVIAHESIDPDDKSILLAALKSTKIICVPELIDMQTGLAVPKQENMIMWAGPGLIQLKLHNESAPDAASWEKALQERFRLAHIVAHELFRSSGAIGTDGRSIDDTFQLSIVKYKLNQLMIDHSLAGSAELQRGRLQPLYPDKEQNKVFRAVAYVKGVSPSRIHWDTEIGNGTGRDVAMKLAVAYQRLGFKPFFSTKKEWNEMVDRIERKCRKGRTGPPPFGSQTCTVTVSDLVESIIR